MTPKIFGRPMSIVFALVGVCIGFAVHVVREDRKK